MREENSRETRRDYSEIIVAKRPWGIAEGQTGRKRGEKGETNGKEGGTERWP